MQNGAGLGGFNMLPCYSPPFSMVDLDNPDLPWVSEDAILTRMITITRFNGLGIDILRHGVAVASIVKSDDPVHRAQAVLHDAQEIIIGDILTPIKNYGPMYGPRHIATPRWNGELDLLEYRLQCQIMEMMGIRVMDEGDDQLVGMADAVAGLIEAKFIYPKEAFAGENEYCWPQYEYSKEEVRKVSEAMDLNNHQAIDRAKKILQEARKEYGS